MTTLLPDGALKLFTLLCVACVMFPAIADTQCTRSCGIQFPLMITTPPPQAERFTSPMAFCQMEDGIKTDVDMSQGGH